MFKNKNFFIAFFLFVLFGGILFLTSQANAQGFNYQLLEKIPGKEKEAIGSDLSKYITAIYDTALVIVVLSAVLMASIGGFMYMTSAGNTAATGTAKSVIFDAVIGLAIALVAYLLLYVINPDLVNVKIKSLSVITTPDGAPIVPTPVPSADQYSDAEARAALQAEGISVNKNNCSNPGATNCTSLDGIPKSTIANLIKLKGDAHCGNFSVTGGTEAGHLSHGPGKPVVDVEETFCIKNFLRDSIAKKTLTSTNNIIQICATQKSQDAAFKCPTIEAAPHFHLVFST